MRFEIYLDDSIRREWRWRLWKEEGKEKKIIATSHDGHENSNQCHLEVRFVQSAWNAPIDGPEFS